MLQKLEHFVLNVVNNAGSWKLEGSGIVVPAGGDGNAVVIVVRNVAKAQVLCPKCGK